MRPWLFTRSAVIAMTILMACHAPDRGDAGSSSGGASGTGGMAGSTDTASSRGGSGDGGAGAGGLANEGGSANNNKGGAGAGGSTINAGNGGAGTAARGGGNGSGGFSATGGLGGNSAGSGGSTSATSSAGSSGGTTAAGRGGVSSAGGGGSGGSVGGSSGTNPTGPCDIYESAGTPCAAAHATARALYAAYSGPLYQVQRASDKAVKDIPVGSGGFADMTVQDSFCSGTSCTIPVIYDQSGNGNHLRVTWWAYWLRNGAKPADANGQKIKVGGHTVSGIKGTGFSLDVGYRTGTQLSGTASVAKGSTTVTFSSPQTLAANTPLFFAANTADCPDGSWPNNCKFQAFWTAADITNSTTVTLKSAYSGSASSSTAVWNHATKGMPTGDDAEAMYAVLDATRYSSACCFGYGNAEMSGWDEGNATMECIYYGSCTQFGQSGGGAGPWVAADLENGMYEGYENGSAKVPSNTSVTGMSYVTTMLKGLSAKDCPAGLTSSGCYALKAGNAQSGKLEWKWNATTKNYGARPPGYSPQKKQGAIILATGGDGSNGGTGTWFEGAITSGAPPDAVDDQVQANVVAAGYGR